MKFFTTVTFGLIFWIGSLSISNAAWANVYTPPQFDTPPTTRFVLVSCMLSYGKIDITEKDTLKSIVKAETKDFYAIKLDDEIKGLKFNGFDVFIGVKQNSPKDRVYVSLGVSSDGKTNFMAFPELINGGRASILVHRNDAQFQENLGIQCSGGCSVPYTFESTALTKEGNCN